MLKRLLLFLIMSISIHAEDISWYDKIHPEVETGMDMSTFDGTHSAVSNVKTSFKEDFGYLETSSSYFALNVDFDYDYIPNIYINYFNLEQTRDAELSEPLEIVNFDFDGLITTKIQYQVLNVILNYKIKKKGGRVKFFYWKFYPGDIRYSVGLNIKKIDWYFQIIQRKDTNAEFKYIRVQTNIPSPYIGVKYYYYNFLVHGDISAISFNEAKTINYQFGIDYKVIKDLYIGVSYTYDDFQATEKEDMLYFRKIGKKFSFKYLF